MTRILRNVLTFQEHIFGDQRDLFEKLGEGQKPLALFITCSDSRISPSLLTQTRPGELFVLRNAGNLIPPFHAGPWAEAATIEYAIRQLRVHDIILCGHSKCGAIHGLLDPAALARLPAVAGWLEHAREVLTRLPPRDSLSADELLVRAIQENVLVQLEHLRTHDAVAEALARRAVRLHGWVYHFEKGEVEYYDPLSGRFISLVEQMRPKLLENAEKDSPRTEWDTHI